VSAPSSRERESTLPPIERQRATSHRRERRRVFDERIRTLQKSSDWNGNSVVLIGSHPKHEPRNTKPETRNPKLETRTPFNPEFETRTRNPNALQPEIRNVVLPGSLSGPAPWTETPSTLNSNLGTTNSISTL